MRLSYARLMEEATGLAVAFDGVTALRHSHTLKLASSADGLTGAQVISGARNEPYRVTLYLVMSDAHSGVPHRAASVMRQLVAWKLGRAALTLVTPLAAYRGMIVTDFTVTEDDRHQAGWTGILTVTQVPGAAGAAGGGSESGGREDRGSALAHFGTALITRRLTAEQVRRLLQERG